MAEDTEGYHPPQSLAALHPDHHLSCTTWFAHLAISSMESLTLLTITSPLPLVLKERDTSFRPQTDMDSTNTTRSVTANQSTSVTVAQLAEDGKRIKETFKNSQTPKHQKCFCIPVKHLHQQLKTSLLHLPPTTSPHLDVFVGRRFFVILFVFLKLSQFLLCLQLFKSHSSFLKS